MNKLIFLTPLALAGLAGCGPKPSQIQAGQWELVSELQSIDIPGAPPEMLQQARAEVGRPNPTTRCMTEEQARDFLGQIVKRGLPPSCTFSDEQYGDGRMRLHVSCAGPAGQQPQQMSFDGNFSRTTLNTRVTMERPNPTGGNAQAVRSVEVVRGRRIGECPAGAATPALPPQPQPAPAPQPARPGQPS